MEAFDRPYRSLRGFERNRDSEVWTLRKPTIIKAGWMLKFARARTARYLGQPPAGFFFWNDRLIAACQLPLIFNTSGFGPGVAATFFFWPLGFFIIEL